MSTNFRNQMKEVMSLAWSFVKRNGFSMSEALRVAWANLKLKAALKVKIVEFYFKKTDGTLRQAFGTLMSDRVPETKGTKKRLIIAKCTSIARKKNGVVSRSVTLLKWQKDE